jgi:hypothetical protein
LLPLLELDLLLELLEPLLLELLELLTLKLIELELSPELELLPLLELELLELELLELEQHGQFWIPDFHEPDSSNGSIIFSPNVAVVKYQRSQFDRIRRTDI